MRQRISYLAIPPTDPEAALRCNVVAGDRRRFWQRKRWLPAFDLGPIVAIFDRLREPGDGLWIKPQGPIPGGAYMRVEKRQGGGRKYIIGLDMTLSPSELSKALYHELEHCRQSRMYSTGEAFHIATHWAAVEGSLSGLGSWYEERAQTAELRHYDRPLVRRRRETH